MTCRPGSSAGLAVGVVTLIGALGSAAAAPSRGGEDYGGGSVIFTRGTSLYRVDARGQGETEIAQLGTKIKVRALRSDGFGRVLLADLAGKWAWMPLDGSTKALAELPCGDGPAQLADDGSAVLCRSPRSGSQALLVELPEHGRAQVTPPAPIALDIAPGFARLTGSGAERRLVWADGSGVWSAPVGDPRRKTKVAVDAPVRGFLSSPDGTRAIGVYTDQVYADTRHLRQADVLMTLQLDGQGIRRKAIRDGVAVEWSHDGQWVLVQDGSSTCIMRAVGGQYKCWRGYTAASLSGDGRWGLALGNRDGSRQLVKVKKPAKKKTPPKPPPRVARAALPDNDDDDDEDSSDMPWDRVEPSDEPEDADGPPPIDDVSVAPPSGPLALYRLRLEGAFTDRPTLLVKIVDGAAVWVPGSP